MCDFQSELADIWRKLGEFQIRIDGMEKAIDESWPSAENVRQVSAEDGES